VYSSGPEDCMDRNKTASSQAAWALLTEGVTKARVEAHRLNHLVSRAMKLIEASEHKDHFYEEAGDIIMAVPTRLQSIETALDRTSLALSKMGEDFLESRLSLSDKTMVDEAVSSAFGGNAVRHSESVQRLAARYMAKRNQDEE